MSLDTSAWSAFTTAELEAKLGVLRALVDSGELTQRSAELELAEIGLIEHELAKRAAAG